MKPMDGIQVLELSTMITASFAAMMLAEQGATVIKIEPLELGDPMRYLGSSKGGISALFANCNRGKRSLRLDLKTDAGKAIVRDLVRQADILLCNFRPGVMDSLGLGSDALRALNPRLIYAALSGFGTQGPERDTPAYDPIIQAHSGFAAVQGQGKDGPEFVRNLTCDKVTAYTACQAVTAALYVREKTGDGQHIDISMMDASLYFLFPDGFMHHTLTDDDVRHTPPLSELVYDLIVTKDGAVTMSMGNPAQQVGLLTALDLLHLFADERFNSMEKLIEHSDEFRAILRLEAAKFETDELLRRLKDNDVPAAKCLDYTEVLAHPQYATNDSIDMHQHPILGSMRRVKPPVKFSGQRLDPGSDSPAHGQHTREVLRELGLPEDDIATMIEQGIAGDVPKA